jgi:hypothetical protein
MQNKVIKIGEGKCKKSISGNTDERIHAQNVIRQNNQSLNFSPVRSWLGGATECCYNEQIKMISGWCLKCNEYGLEIYGI